MPTSPLAFKLSLDDNGYGDHQLGRTAEDNDNRLMEMLAAQAAHREDGSNAGDEDSVALDPKLSDEEKKMTLQKSLHMAASNGDVERVRRLVVGNPRKYVDVNVADEEGTAPLIYASCFVCVHQLTIKLSQNSDFESGPSRGGVSTARGWRTSRPAGQESMDGTHVGYDQSS